MTTKRLHQTKNYFFNKLGKIHIIVAGCGGTGSYVLPGLARLNHILISTGYPGIFVTCYDDGVVRPHLKYIQNFNESDIGMNKAVAMIEKINMVYGYNWDAVPNKHDPTRSDGVINQILISCVDDPIYRNEVRLNDNLYYDSDQNRAYWIDAGNAKDFGQIILGSSLVKQPKDTNEFAFVHKLPTVTQKYGDMRKYDADQEIKSCSIEQRLQDQNLYVNQFAALYALKMLEDLITNQFLNYHGWVFNLQSGTAQKIKL